MVHILQTNKWKVWQYFSVRSITLLKNKNIEFRIIYLVSKKPNGFHIKFMIYTGHSFLYVYLLLSCLSMWFFISWFLNVYTQIYLEFSALFRIAKSSYTHLPHSVSIARQWRSKYWHLISVILWLTSNVSDFAYWNKYQYINNVQT